MKVLSYKKQQGLELKLERYTMCGGFYPVFAMNKIKQLKPGQLSTAKKKIWAGLMKLDENRPNYGKLVKEHLQLLEAIEKAESGYVKS